MVKNRLSNVAKHDLITSVRLIIIDSDFEESGMAQADKYFDSFFEYFNIITERSFSFVSVDFIRQDIDVVVLKVLYSKRNNGIEEIITIIGRQDLKNIV